MLNPILQQIRQRSSNGILNALKGGNPNHLFASMLQNNPQFSQFVNANKGKSIQQIAREHSIPISFVTKLMRT